MGHTKVRCTKPLVEDDDAGHAGDSYGDGFAASGGDAEANDGGGNYSASNNGVEAISAPAAAGDWGASSGDAGGSW